MKALEGMTDTILGGNKDRFLNYIGTIFIFIFVSNFSGLLGLRNPTADYGVTFMLGFFYIFNSKFPGYKEQKVKTFYIAL